MSFRLDRFLTIYLFNSFISKRQLAENKRISILMYHSISDDREHGVHPYYKINTAPAIFADQMRFLYENNYSVIDLKSVKGCFDKKYELNKKIVVITFDDGYHDFYTNAFPILQKYHFTATVFLPTAFIGNEGIKLRGKAHLTWNQISELADSGISFGSHTVTHPELSNLSNKDVEYEIRQSKKAIEDNLGKAIDTFSYPFKFPDEKKVFINDLRKILQKCEYHHGVSTRIGTTSKSDDIYFMKRIPVNTDDDIPLFKAKLEGGYNWLNKPQYIYKIIKRKLLSSV
ncbi:MAG: polysaccharide deacetylase family protein [Smithella sp.]